MAINFTDSPSNGATQTIGGRTYTYNSAKNKWDTTATEVTGPTATVYASVDNLPTSGNITGSQAFVSGTNRLYIWNGSGWYNIALINNTPTISGVSSSYGLADDGTATTVTITATDPEGLPITYSIASDTSGNIATVTQGTGSNTNVFTITPSTNTAHAGTFSLTFRASDGVNLATAVSSFTLQFSVQNQKYTTALITSVGANNATNRTWDDKSASDHTITTSGTYVHQTTFSPYRHGGYSVYFDGADDYLQLPSHSSLAMGTSEFTWEFWVYLKSDTGATQNLLDLRNGSSGLKIDVATSSLAIRVYSEVTANNPITGESLDLNKWYHVALVRDSSDNLKMYLNGSQTGSTATSHTSNYTSNSGRIGIRYGDLTQEMHGYISDLRIVKGTAITPTSGGPTERLTAVSNTSLLTCHLPYIADGSTNAHTITISGGPETRPFAPYDAQEYTAADHSGSVRMDGSGTSLGISSNADFGLGTGDFTVEWWSYFNTISNYPYPFDMRAADTDSGLNIYVRTNISNVAGAYVNGTQLMSGTHSFVPKQWIHYAVCKTGGYLKGYYNGKQDFSIADTRDYGSSKPLKIGSVWSQSNHHYDGNLADFRVVKGTAVYTGEFTPPTEPLTAITNTKVLIQSTDAGIIDKSQSLKRMLLTGDTKSSTTQSKYLTSSMYFDGSGDYIEVPHDPVLTLTKDFTIECWAYFSALSSNRVVIEKYDNTSAASWELYWRASGSSIAFWADSSAILQDPSSSTITTGQWYHIAVSRTGSAVKLFIDGTEVDSATTSTAFTSTVAMQIGRQRINNTNYFNGYLSDVRITNGLGRYTSNFTPPAAALQG